MEIPSLRSETGLRNRCIMELMYEAGLRVGEALALKPRGVVIEEKRVVYGSHSDTKDRRSGNG